MVARDRMTHDGPGRPLLRRNLIGVGLISATLLLTELALTRTFSVVMYYHFAFLSISIALFGLSASGVGAYVFRRRLEPWATQWLLSRASLLYAVLMLIALFLLVRIHPELTYSPKNLVKFLLIYSLAALPFVSGGFVVTMAVSRFSERISIVYAADLIGAAMGCLLLIPLLDRLGAPGVVLTASALAVVAATLFAPQGAALGTSFTGGAALVAVLAVQLTGLGSFDVAVTKGHLDDEVLFSKWNSFSRIGVYQRTHGDWSLSDRYRGELPRTLYMDIDSAVSTPILGVSADVSDAHYLRYELTALAYHLKDPGFNALVIGPGGGRDLVSALVFGARQVDGVEINPIIANDVMRDRFQEFSGGIYTNPRVRIAVDDGRSFVRRSGDRYDIIQASLVDTWAATAAGAYTLTENSLYTVEAFDDYFDHLTSDGVLTITRWVADGLRLISLAQEAFEERGWDPRTRIAIVQQGDVATFLFKRSPLTAAETMRLRTSADDLGFRVIYAPAPDGGPVASDGKHPQPQSEKAGDYATLLLSSDRREFYERYPQDIWPTNDDRPFFFHTTKLQDQLDVALGKTLLFGNGLSALLTLMGCGLLALAAATRKTAEIAD
jgi:spermidine synthase